MAISIITFVRRKASLSPAEFQQHYEEVHMPLLKELFGRDFCKSHTRYFLQYSAEEGSDADGKRDKKLLPITRIGDASSIDYDCVGILEFENQDALDTFHAKYADPELMRRLREDEAKFVDVTALKVLPVTGPRVTRHD